MKYLVITAKHHDGFAMFDTEASEFNIVDATPLGRDPIAEVARACRQHGIRFGIYYSQHWDWHHYQQPAPEDKDRRVPLGQYVKEVAIPQVGELMSNYGRIDLMWWDIPGPFADWMLEGFLDEVRRQPDIVMNNRLSHRAPGDFVTPEQNIPAVGLPSHVDWETCMTMNTSWGFKRGDDRWKSPQRMLRDLADIVSKGGSFLMNVGPDARGRIPQASVDRLLAIGRWMDTHGEAIHGAQRSPFRHSVPWGRCTRRENTVYCFVFDRPADGVIRVPLKNKSLKATLLHEPSSRVTLEAKSGGVELGLAEEQMEPLLTVVRLDVDGALQINEPPNLARGKKATASASDADSSPSRAIDGDPLSAWVNTEQEHGWIEIDLGRPTRMDKVAVMAQGMGRTKFRIVALAGGESTTIAEGRYLPHIIEHSFEPVTAECLRFEAIQARHGIRVGEIEVYHVDQTERSKQ
jgi:alpha-L-fucosidase